MMILDVLLEFLEQPFVRREAPEEEHCLEPPCEPEDYC